MLEITVDLYLDDKIEKVLEKYDICCTRTNVNNCSYSSNIRGSKINLIRFLTGEEYNMSMKDVKDSWSILGICLC